MYEELYTKTRGSLKMGEWNCEEEIHRNGNDSSPLDN